MADHFETYTEEVFLRFKEIDASDHRQIINFYENNEDVLLHLDLQSYLEVKLAYAAALFEIGDHQHFIPLCDELIEEVIYHNITDIEGEDVFETLIFKKAAARYHQLEYDAAEQILWQLIRINPHHVLAAYLLKRCKIRNQPEYLRQAKSISIFLFLLSACIIAAELLFVQPFFSHHHKDVQVFRTIVFLAGIILLVLSDGWHRMRTFHEVNKAVALARGKADGHQ